MQLNKLRTNKSVVIMIFQLCTMIIMALILTVINADFDLSKFNWLVFSTNLLFGLSAKTSFTNYAADDAMKAEEIIILEKSIDQAKRDIFENRLEKKLESEIYRLNKIEKLRRYLLKIDRKMPKKSSKFALYKEKRINIVHLQNAYMSKDIKKIEEYEELVKSDSLKVRYPQIKLSVLFNYGNQAMQNDFNELSFSRFRSSMNRGFLPLIFGFIFSLMLSSLEINKNPELWPMFLKLAGYLFMIFSGMQWGNKNGKEIILNDYNQVLNNVLILIKKIRNDIEK